MKQRQITIALDSGEYSRYRAKKKGKVADINIDRLIFDQLIFFDQIAFCFNLDVIDPKDDRNGEVSYRNFQYIRSYRPDVIPIYHWGKELPYLEKYLTESPIVAVGGSADAQIKKREDQLSHLWRTHLLDRRRRPRAMIHGLGLTSTRLVSRWRWYSVDSTSWAIDAGNRVILVPRKSGSNYDFRKQPIRVSVTTKHPYPSKHIARLPKHRAHHVMEYLEMLGFAVGRGDNREEPHYAPGLCNSATMRYQINAIFYAELGWATGTKVFLAGNFESMANREMERKIMQAVFGRGLDYYRLVSFVDKHRLNIINLKMEQEESYGSDSQRIERRG